MKIKIIKKCFNGSEKLKLLKTIGVPRKVSDSTVKDAEKSTVCSTLEKNKTALLNQARVRLNKQMKTKTSQPLPPEEKSMSQAIKGVKFIIHYQVYYSSRVDVIYQK